MSSQRYYCPGCSRIFFDDTDPIQDAQDIKDVEWKFHESWFMDGYNTLHHLSALCAGQQLQKYNETPESRICYLENKIKVLLKLLEKD
jgi:hypothetical protein